MTLVELRRSEESRAMTEAEWLEGDDPYSLFQYVQSRASKRKLRLFACACCRRIWHLLSDERSRRAVEIAERYADGLASKKELSAAQEQAAAAVQDAESRCQPLHEILFRGSPDLPPEEKWVLQAQWLLAAKHKEAAQAAKSAASAADHVSELAETMSQALAKAMSAEAIGNTVPVIRENLSAYSFLLRCVFGNPFRAATADPCWHTASVTGFARALYHGSAFDRLPLLADSLAEAGCHEEAVLSHCRSAAPHARGCWAVDAVLRIE